MTKKNKLFAVSASAALVASAIVPVAASAAVDFNDKDQIADYALPFVEYLVENEVMNGKSGNMFDPKGNLNRAEASKMFSVAFDLEVTGEVSFSDIKDGIWYTDFVLAAADNGIVKGYDNGTFEPLKEITRGEAAIMIARALGEEVDETVEADLSQFADGAKVPAWAAGYLAAAVDKGIIKGSQVGDQLFLNWDAKITRQDFAVMFQRTGVAAEMYDAVEDVQAPEVNEELVAAVEAMEAAEAKVAAVEEVTAENVETLTAEVAALEEAIAAVEAFEDETTTEAVAAAKATVADAQSKIAAFEAIPALAVEKVESTSETTIEVTFGKDTEVKSEDLAEKALTLTAGDKVLTAKFVSLTGKVAVYEVVEGELVDATEYTVAGENVEAKTFVAAFGEEVVTSFEFVTSGLLANDPESDFEAADARSLTYKVLNQYGEEMEVAEDATFTAVVKKGAMPLSATAQQNELTINEKLVEGDVLTITIQSKDKDGKVVAEKTTEIKVSKYTEEVATTVSKIEANADADKETLKDLKAGDEFTLKATVLDQNSNTMNSAVRWMSSDASIVAIKADEEVTFKDGATADFVAKKEGKVTITAFTPDGKASKTFEVTVGQGKLSVIDTTEANVEVENKKSATIFVNEIPKDAETDEVITFANVNGNEIPVKAADLKVEVTTDNKDFAATDVTVEKISDAAGNLTALKVTSNRTAQTTDEKAGDYSTGLVYTVKLSTADEKVAAKTFVVTSKIDTEVASIETAKNVEFRAGNEPTQAITFKNANGEVINVLSSAVKFLNNENEVKLLTSNNKGEFATIAENATAVVTGLKFTNATSEKVVISVGTETATVNVKVNDAAVLKSISLGANVTAKGTVVSGEENYILPISLKDQDGNAFVPANLEGFAVKYSGAADAQEDFTVAYYEKNEDGELVATDAKTDDTVGVALVAETEGSLNGLLVDKTYSGLQLTFVDGDTTINSNKISVVVGAIAQVTSATAKVEATNLTVGAETEITVVPVDQYGNVIEMTDEEATEAITLTDSLTEEVLGDLEDVAFEAVVEEDKLIGYKATLTGGKVGSANITAKVEIDYNGEEEGGVKTATTSAIAMKVSKASDVVTSLEIKEVSTVNNSGTEGETSVQLEASAKNVALATNDVIWAVTSIIDEEGKKVEFTESLNEDGTVKSYTFGEEVVTISEDGTLTAPKGLTVKVTAKAESHNDTVATVDVQFDKTPAKFAKDLTATIEVEGEEVKVDTTKALELTDAGIVLTFTGTDQYGEEGFAIPADLATIFVADATVATAVATKDSNVITITAAEGAEEEATTTVTVRYGGETLKFNVVIPTAAE